MPGDVRVDDRELRRALERLESELADATPTHTAVVRGLLPGVVIRTPRRTSALAGSWRASGTPGAGEISSDLEYAGPIEYGVAGRFAPFAMVRDAIAASEHEIERTYETAIAKSGGRAGFGIRR